MLKDDGNTLKPEKTCNKHENFFFFFLISQKDFITKREAPQKYIGYIQKEHLTRKRKAGKKNFGVLRLGRAQANLNIHQQIIL
jgi:hypothetical protein